MIFKIEIEGYFKIKYPFPNNNGIIPTNPFLLLAKTISLKAKFIINFIFFN